MLPRSLASAIGRGSETHADYSAVQQVGLTVIKEARNNSGPLRFSVALNESPARSIAWETWLNSGEGRHYWGTPNPEASVDSPPDVPALLYTEEERSRLWHVFMAGWSCAKGTWKETSLDEALTASFAIEHLSTADAKSCFDPNSHVPG
jgi:hypothetical protein